ncbi:unnamed protein product [Ceutorhynchus assimilis]|uniref:Choline transporter-like protein n=1 Tax=Ceutorhynchus assimilis TaxID=467358 RepID=A0A9N9QI94_9CUCU|nr:unnamed protein product [Ceutorhynchus assimilis]
MGLSGSRLEPQELITFKKLPTNVSLESIEIPESPKNRRPTNVKWLVILGIFIAVFLPFLIYTMYYVDLKRIQVGYDKCGNVCGKKNAEWSGIECSGKNFTNLPYMQYEGYSRNQLVQLDVDFRERRCVASCDSGHHVFEDVCVKDRDISDYFVDDIGFGTYMHSVKWQVIVCCLISILISMGMVFLFRYAVRFVVWGILIGSLLAFTVLVIGIWVLYGNMSDTGRDNDPRYQVLGFAIALTILVIGLAIVLIWCRKKVHLVILLLKEATKAVFDMPGLIAIPVVCTFSIMILTAIYLIITFFMLNAGTLTPLNERSDTYTYQLNTVMKFSIVYNLVVYLWLVQFFTGIQYMVIAGAVSKWYFARDKGYLGNPIGTAISIAFKFHLGTVAFGAMLITLVQLIKSIILGLIKNEKIKVFVQSCIESIEKFFKFLSKNAYIITAMHGQAFLRSGKRAAKLIFQNIDDIIAVNFIGDFVLGMAKLLIVAFTLLISWAILTIAPGIQMQAEHGSLNFIAYIVIGLVSILSASISFGVFETTIDTLFMCYCEDNMLNDGMAKPYYMSRNMMEFVQESKVIYAKKA